ncbi:hypothetical protein [Absidia glauca]|uniref:Uncharacterized protein n=1 Tax=Absidia glauca TaxID=4829 RepID=A0A163K039_ABSGL|nr:hypothetical protein [Absidia glauca]
MWRSHTTTDAYGHCDIWHTTDTDNPPTTNTSPPVIVQRTPCVSLLEKRTSYRRLSLCDRPYSPFSGYYDQDDIYVGREYDIFGGEAPCPSDSSTASLSSSFSSQVDIFCDDPFSTPQEVPQHFKRTQGTATVGSRRPKKDQPSTNHDDLVDYPPLWLFSDGPHPSVAPLDDSKLEYS